MLTVYRINFKQWLKRRFAVFLSKRMPAKQKQLLTQRNIFILPSRFGWFYLFFTLVLFLLATNYQNNTILLLSFLLASLFITNMLISFSNLSGLTIEKLNVGNEFDAFGEVEQPLLLTFKLYCDRPKYQLYFNFQQSEQQILQPNSFEDSPHLKHGIVVTVPYICHQRGIHQLGRLKISSNFALGLFTTWTLLDFNCKVWAYPKAIQVKNKPLQLTNEQNTIDNDIEHVHSASAGQDFYQLKPYLQGETLAKVSWPQVAKGRGWWTKETTSETKPELWITLANMPAVQLEQKLSQAVSLIKYYHYQHIPFGLTLGDDNQRKEMGSGDDHFHTCLYQCAIYLNDEIISDD